MLAHWDDETVEPGNVVTRSILGVNILDPQGPIGSQKRRS